MKRLILLFSLITVLFLVGCGSQTLYLCMDGTPGGAQQPEPGKNLIFICPDGRETENINLCTFEKQISISLRDAETKSLNFVNGYVRTSGWTATLINVFPEEGDFQAQIVVSKRDEQSYETTVQVDGRTGAVICKSNCLYTTQI